VTPGASRCAGQADEGRRGSRLNRRTINDCQLYRVRWPQVRHNEKRTGRDGAGALCVAGITLKTIRAGGLPPCQLNRMLCRNKPDCITFADLLHAQQRTAVLKQEITFSVGIPAPCQTSVRHCCTQFVVDEVRRVGLQRRRCH